MSIAVPTYHERVAAQKRSAILGSATELFLAQGYDGTSLAQIAKGAGVSTATLFKRFPTKAALFDAIVTDYWRPEEVPFDTPSPGDPKAGLTAIGRHYVALMTRDEMAALFRIVIAEAPRFPELTRRQFDLGKLPYFNRVCAYLEAEHEAENLRVDDPVMAATQFLGMIANFAFWPRMLLVDWSPARSELDYAVDEAVKTTLARFAASQDLLGELAPDAS